MYKLNRRAAPNCLSKNWEQWGKEWAEKKARDSKASFSWRSDKGKDEWFALLRKMSCDHCAFCDGNFASSKKTVEHFRPKSQFPLLAYQWENLFLCCDACQAAKLNQFDAQLLKPDESDYDFAHYFICDFKEGTISANPLVSPEAQQSAECSIRLYKLNRPELCKARLREYRNFSKRDDDDEFDDYNYRYFLS